MVAHREALGRSGDRFQETLIDDDTAFSAAQLGHCDHDVCRWPA
jgi:hypothetical protein